jgi:hypothetical protein
MVDWGRSGWFYQPACFFSAWAWKAKGPLDEELHYAFDVDFWLKLASVGLFASTRSPLSAALIHENAKTRAFRDRLQAELVTIQTGHGYPEVARRLEKRSTEQPTFFSKAIRRARQDVTAVYQRVLARLSGDGPYPL